MRLTKSPSENATIQRARPCTEQCYIGEATDVKSMRVETVVSNLNGQLHLKVGHGECAF